MLMTVRYRPGANASPKPTSPANVHKAFAAYWNLVPTCCCAYPGLHGAATSIATTIKTSDRSIVSCRDRNVCMTHRQARRNEPSPRPHLPRRTPPREQSARARSSHWQDIADAVADVYTPKLG